MAEALLLSVIEKLESKRAEMPEFMKGDIKGVVNDLNMVLDFLRDKKLVEGSSLNSLISDFIEIAQGALVATELKNILTFIKEIKSVRSLLRDAKMRMLQFGVDGGLENVEEGGEEGEEDVVGLQEDVDLLFIEGIFHQKRRGLLNRCFLTTCICGIVGIGKTTLARQVYNHDDVVELFNRRAWVCVSSNLSRREVFMKLIQQVVECEGLERDSLLEKMERADNQSLQQMLHQHLEGLRYFIVLDDLPKNMDLNSILKALPREDTGSRLLLTSRSKVIQETIQYSHQMKTLDSNESWQLFIKTLSFYGGKFTSEDSFPKHLNRKGKRMLRKCGGLPLAIKEVGRQIAKGRRSGSEWEQLLESIDMDSILVLLEPSYKLLDPELKSSFLHLAFFKENTTVAVAKLTRIWVVGELVREIRIEKILDKLASESIIEVNQRVFRITRFDINPLLHKLSIKKAEEEIGFEILSSNGNNRPSKSPRHRAIYCSRDKYSFSTNQDIHLFSLFFHGGGYFDDSLSYWKSFEKLKILDFEDFGLKILPQSISTLMELRYLGLRNNYIQELPHSLGCLEKLEVLDISLNFMLEVPDILWGMGNLRNVFISDVIYRKPFKLDALQNLEALLYISVDNWTSSSSSRMTNIWKLGLEEVHGYSDTSKLFRSLTELRKLQCLILRGSRVRSMPCLDELGLLNHLTMLKLNGLLARLPNNFPPTIRYLKLVNSKLDEDPMPVLDKLRRLEFLILRNAYTGEKMVIMPRGFSTLEFLYFQELQKLRNVQVGLDALLSLKEVEINNCPYLDAENYTAEKIRTRSSFLCRLLGSD